MIQQLKSKRLTIKFCWIPSHVGIRGNEIADQRAKAALARNQTSPYKIPYTDYIPKVKQYIKTKWQQRWDLKNNERINDKGGPIKLHEIQPSIQPVFLNGYSRKDEVIIHRLRIGHTRLTHRHLMEGIDRNEPPCNYCYIDTKTIKHILIECQHFDRIRSRHFQTNDIRDLFDRIPLRHIISFLKEANLYNEI